MGKNCSLKPPLYKAKSIHELMKILLLVFLPVLLTFGCKPKYNQEKADLFDLNIYLETNREIDSVFFSNITQDREFQYMPYSDTLRISLNDSINDLYNLHFYTKEGLIFNQLWLNGENLVLKGQILDRLKVDTLLGSSLYYKSIDFRKEYRALIEQEADSVAIEAFLMKKLTENIDNPFSIHITKELFYRNLNKESQLRKIYSILANQPEEIRNHLINPIKKIENLLTVDTIDFSRFQFYDTQGKIVSIKLEKGKHFLIDFWFINCPPCIRDHKIVVNKLDFLESKNVELIGISIDKDQKEWEEYLIEEKFSWLNYRELDDYYKRITTDMLISAFPTYLLVDDNGNILRRTNSLTEMEEYLNNMSL